MKTKCRGGRFLRNVEGSIPQSIQVWSLWSILVGFARLWLRTVWGGLEYGERTILVWCDGYGYGLVWSGTIWYGMLCGPPWQMGKRDGRGPIHEDVHLSFLKVGQKAEEPAAG